MQYYYITIRITLVSRIVKERKRLDKILRIGYNKIYKIPCCSEISSLSSLGEGVYKRKAWWAGKYQKYSQKQKDLFKEGSKKIF